MMSAFVIPIVANSVGFVQSGLRLLLGVDLVIPTYSSALPDRANLVYTAVALIIRQVMTEFDAVGYAGGTPKVEAHHARRASFEQAFDEASPDDRPRTRDADDARLGHELHRNEAQIAACEDIR